MKTGEAQQWTSAGTAVFLRLVDHLADDELDRPTLLPDWTRRRLVAHLAANAEGLGRLVTWARTGEVTPMYASPAERIAAIDRGEQLSTTELRAWVKRSADELDIGLRSLSAQDLTATIVTSQGRTIPASLLDWLRAREVNIHAIDLDAGFGFDDLAPAFTHTLITDIARLRAGRRDGPALELLATDTGDIWRVDGTGQPAQVAVPQNRLAGWLTGREKDLPPLPAWL